MKMKIITKKKKNALFVEKLMINWLINIKKYGKILNLYYSNY